MTCRTIVAAVCESLKDAPQGIHQRRLVVACSGGVDSMVLLRAALEARNQGAIDGLKVLHVNHQLHPEARKWQETLEAFCEEHGLPCGVATLDLGDIHANLEARAREARYRALIDMSHPEEGIFLAHHAEDQAETVLLRWLRGAGVTGLSGMAPWSHRQGRWFARPLLAFDKQTLRQAAEAWCLPFAEDPSNQDPSFDRNFLRHRIFPLLRQRWPSLNRTLQSSASTLRKQLGLLQELAREDRRQCADKGGVSLLSLRRLSTERQSNLLAYWLKEHDTDVPSQRWLQTVVGELATLQQDSRWSKKVGHLQLMYGQGKVYLLSGDWEEDWRKAWLQGAEQVWRGEEVIRIGQGFATQGKSCLQEAYALQPLSALAVKPKHLRVSPEGPRKLLKKLFQERAIPWFFRPWWPCVRTERGCLVLGLGWTGEWVDRDRQAGMRSTIVWHTFRGELERF